MKENIHSLHRTAEPLHKTDPTPNDAVVSVSNISGVKNIPVAQSSAPANNTDRTRVRAKAPTSTLPPNPFVPLSETKIGTLRIGELEHLAAHGVTPGIVGGIFCLQRKYVPTAEGLVAQVRGSN